MAELNPQAKALLAEASGLPPIYTLTIEEVRARMRAALVQDGPQPAAQVNDIAINNGNAILAARAYHLRPGHSLPILVFFHGGGWILNDLDTHDQICSTLANGMARASPTR